MNKRFGILFILALVGIALSALSLYQFVSVHLGSGLDTSFCSISEHIDCARVHLSPWSSLFGIPLASYGLGFYFLIAIISLIGFSSQVLSREESRDFITFSTFMAVLFSITLFLISEFQIGALCPVCLAMYLTNFSLFYFSWSMPSEERFMGRIRNAFRAGIRLIGIWIPQQRSFKGFLARMGTLLGLCFVLALIISGDRLMAGLYITMQPEGSDPIEDKKNATIAQFITEWENEKVVPVPILRNQVVAGDFIKGKEGAPVQIVEFSDFECPHCQQLGTALAVFLKEFPNAFEVIHKDFPLDNSCNKFSGPIHAGSCKAAEFARCAGEQGKFWNVVEFFFDSGIPEANDAKILGEKLLNESASLGLESGPLRECLESGRHLEKIKKDAELGDALNIQGTPAVWINGKYLRTPHPDVVRAMIIRNLEKLQK